MDSTGKPDISLDSPMEDASLDLPGGRRPGNLWTPQAREDMFRRREAGETWETICLDYPKRSRHAMQQQYSMMKKQRALANGTWTSNRRGRKRKNPSPEKWPSLARRQQSRDTPDDELTEDDEFADLDSDEIQDYDDVDGSFRDDSFANGRPNPLARAITDPLARTVRSKIVTFPNLPSSTGLAAATINGSNPTISIDRVPDHPDLVNSAYPPKRRKTSPALTTKLEPPPPAMATSNFPTESFLPPEVAFDKEELMEFVGRGTEKARHLANLYESEKSAQRKIFEASIARYNRRINDSQEKLRYALHEHADILKTRERENAEHVKNLIREHIEEKQIMRRELDKEQRQREDIQTKNIDSLMRQNDELRRHAEDLERTQQGQSVRYVKDEHELAGSKKQSHPPETSSLTPPTGSNGTNTAMSNEGSLRQDSAIRELHQQIQNCNAVPLKVDEETIQQSVNKANADFETLSLSITKLNTDFEDMSSKQVIKALSVLQLQNESTHGSLKDITRSLDELRRNREAIVAELDKLGKQAEPSRQSLEEDEQLLASRPANESY